MNELAPEPLKRPLDPAQLGGESAALGGLLDLINNPELEMIGGAFSEVPDSPPPAPAPVQSDPPPPHIDTPPPPSLKRPVGRCLLLSGRLAAGKDYVAEATKARILGFADPMYTIASFFFGVEVTSTKGKDLPGMRDFLQKLGQWGRNEVNDKYPYNPTRAMFVQMIRSLGMRGVKAFSSSIDWSTFGTDPEIWIKCCAKRASNCAGDKRVAITNARFKNELDYFRALPEWDHWHVMCSPQTWAERLAKKKLSPQSKEVSDISEQIAIALDRDVATKIRAGGTNMLRVIWNDHRPAPSPRLYTLNQFLQELAIADLPVSNVGVDE
jgi:hypothetical protein